MERLPVKSAHTAIRGEWGYHVWFVHFEATALLFAPNNLTRMLL